PRIDVVLPGRTSGDPIQGRRQVPPAQRNAPIDRQELSGLLREGAYHLLGIGLAAHFAHGLHDQRQSLLPTAGPVQNAVSDSHALILGLDDHDGERNPIILIIDTKLAVAFDLQKRIMHSPGRRGNSNQDESWALTRTPSWIRSGRRSRRSPAGAGA